MSRDKVWVLTTTNNEVLTFDNDDVINFIYSVHSHEKAFALANYFYGENIEDYSDVIASYKLTDK